LAQVYICQFFTYLMLRKHYANLKREYRSPLGEAGACYGVAFFSIALLGSLAFQPHVWYTPVALLTYFAGCSVFYWVGPGRDDDVGLHRCEPERL
jgi:amino acid permease